MGLFGVTTQGFVYDVGCVINECGTCLRALQLTLTEPSMVVCQPQISTIGRRWTEREPVVDLGECLLLAAILTDIKKYTLPENGEK